MPSALKNLLGSEADELIEDISSSKRGPFRDFNSRFVNGIELLVPNTANTINPSLGERTYRGTNYQPFMFIPSEKKPDTWLQPEIVNQMKKNGVIKTALFLKKAPILAVIQKSFVKHEVPRIEAYLNFVLKPILYNLVFTSLFAIDYGLSLHEKVWIQEDINFKYEQSGTMRTFKGSSLHFKKIKWNNPLTIDKINISQGTQDFDGYEQKAGSKTTPIPPEKAFFWGKGQEDSLWGTSDLDAVYEYWYWLELLSGYYMRYMERLATPPLVAYAPPGTTYSADENGSVENMSWMANVTGNLRDGMTIALPSQFDTNARHRIWDIRELQISTRGDLYQTAISWLENAIFKGTFVPDKPVSQGTQSFGSYALADIQFEAFLVGEEADLFSIVYNIEKYIIRPLLDVNFGTQVANAKLFYPPMSRELKQRVYEVFKDLISDHPDFHSINFQEIAEELGIPLYTPEEIKKKKEEQVADAQAMMEATTPPQPEAPPASDETKSQSIYISPVMNPIVDMSTLEQTIRDEAEKLKDSIPQPPMPISLEAKRYNKVIEYDKWGRISGWRDVDAQ